MEPITVKYKVLDTRAKVPSYATPGSAAADLCAVLDAPLTLAPWSGHWCPPALPSSCPAPTACTGVRTQRPFHQARPVHGQRRGCGGQRLPRRAEGAHGQSGREAYTIQPGERVAQLCIAPVYTAAFVPAEELGDTQRGEGGFGSTGK